MGCYYAMRGLRDRAFEEWSRCVEIDPGFGEAHYALAWVYYDAKDAEKGWEHTEKAMAAGVRLESIKDLLDKFVPTRQPIQVKKEFSEALESVQGESKFKWVQSFLPDLIAVLAVSTLCFLLLKGTLRNGYPRDYLDATLAFYVAKIKMLLVNHSLFTESWYFGYEMLKYYPPLSTFLPAFFAFVTGNLLLSYYYLCLFFYTALSIGIYMFASRLFESRLAGLVSAVLIVFVHVNFISFQGHYWETSRLMGTAAVPWTLYFIYRTLKEGRKSDLLSSIILSSYCLLSNLFSAIDLVILAAPYLLINLNPSWTFKRQADLPPRYRGWAVLIAFLLGVPALTLWWYVPSVIPHGFSAYLTGSSGFTPPVAETFLQLFPPSYMPAIQLPITILGLAGILLGVIRQSRRGSLMAVWFAASSFMAYIVRIQSSRVVLVFGVCLVFGAGYIIKEAQRRVERRRKGIVYQIILLIAVILPLGLFSVQYLPRYQAMAIVDDTYLSSDEYIVSTWLSENLKPDFRAYLMWGSWFRGSQWANAFYPELKQVLGGYDQGARAETDAPFIFDDLVKWSEDAAELQEMAKQLHIKYIVIDVRFMESQAVGYMKFRDTALFKPIEDLNSRLRYASVYEVSGVTGLEGTESWSEYHYWDFWRITGVFISSLLLVLFILFIRRLSLRGDMDF